MAYKNPISKSNVGKDKLWEQRKDLYGTCCFYYKKWYNVKYGMRVFRKGKLQMTISMERDVVDYSSKWMGAIYFLVAICGLEL